MQQKFCLLYKQSKFGIERLEIYDSSDDVTKHAISKIITLENCIKITPISINSFKVVTKAMQYDFVTVTEQDLTDWVTAIQSVAFKDDVSKVTIIEEDNDLYCSSGEGVFQVKVWPSDASKVCGLDPNKTYTLILTSTAIQIRNNDNKILYTWPYCYIRRYGYRSGKFTFEAGRKCDSGEGVFHLEYANQQEIFRCLSSKMKSMKKILNGESTSSLLDCGDNQFQAALSMEARSRSPLPPSPTSSTRIHDIDLNNSNHSSTKSLVSFTDSLDKSINERRPLPKPKPYKPPRKHLPLISSNKFFQDKFNPDCEASYEIMPQGLDSRYRYDEVEYRKEAWKTQGISEVKHTEIVDTEDDLEDYISWSGRKSQENLQIEPQVMKTAPKILSKPANMNDENYDKLQFFGSSSKLSNTQSGYKQVAPVPVQPSHLTPSWSDYDEVEINMQAVRLADDSHLGYGMIRKASQPKTPDSPKVTHQVYNDNLYAVVSKPKQV